MLALPIPPQTLLSEVIDPALSLLPERMGGNAPRRMLVAIGLQESGLAHRHQVGGPAHGLWQFEQGGVLSTLRWWRQHTRRGSANPAAGFCEALGYHPSARTIYHAIEHDDVLAAGIARLYLWADPRALPGPDDDAAAWTIYLNTWRPGKPRPEVWKGYWQRAAAAVAQHGRDTGAGATS